MAAPLQAEAATLTLRNVMVGNSGSDQTWICVGGKPASVANECAYQEWSLLYANNDGKASPDKVAPWP
jgi:hypothetical protein